MHPEVSAGSLAREPIVLRFARTQVVRAARRCRWRRRTCRGPRPQPRPGQAKSEKASSEGKGPRSRAGHRPFRSEGAEPSDLLVLELPPAGFEPWAPGRPVSPRSQWPLMSLHSMDVFDFCLCLPVKGRHLLFGLFIQWTSLSLPWPFARSDGEVERARRGGSGLSAVVESTSDKIDYVNYLLAKRRQPPAGALQRAYSSLALRRSSRICSSAWIRSPRSTVLCRKDSCKA